MLTLAWIVLCSVVAAWLNDLYWERIGDRYRGLMEDSIRFHNLFGTKVYVKMPSQKPFARIRIL